MTPKGGLCFATQKGDTWVQLLAAQAERRSAPQDARGGGIGQAEQVKATQSFEARET